MFQLQMQRPLYKYDTIFVGVISFLQIQHMQHVLYKHDSPNKFIIPFTNTTFSLNV